MDELRAKGSLLYSANSSSWLDILDDLFKYESKSSSKSSHQVSNVFDVLDDFLYFNELAKCRQSLLGGRKYCLRCHDTRLQ